MLTGDRRRPAAAIAREIGIAEVEAELLPEAKMQRVRQLATEGHRVAMLGDGINDAPALAAASVGVAVAGASDITAEAADVVYLPQSLEGLPQLFTTSRRAMRTAWMNIVLFAGVLNMLAVLACATGRLGPIGAACTHQLSSFCVMMNSLRLLRVDPIGAGFWRRFAPWWAWIAGIRPAPVWQWLVVWRREALRTAAVAVVALTALAGFYAVRPGEVGIVERFGRKLTPFSESGLHYKLPWPMEKLTRVPTSRVRVAEIGFRSGVAGTAEPGAYEWNVQHRSGRFQSRPDESSMLTGDQNMIELNATVHYAVARPDAFLFGVMDGESVVRAAAESALQSIITTTPLDDVLTTGRGTIERRALADLQHRVDRYDAGVTVLEVKLQDVHPAQGVVDAFREVSAALEEKNRTINTAEAYRNEQVPLARGRAVAMIANASGYTAGRNNRAEGDAMRFDQRESAYRAAPGPTETRLYLETMERVLPGKRKFIVDSGKARRQLLLLEDGVELAPPGAAALGGK
jgi:HflK protein